MEAVQRQRQQHETNRKRQRTMNIRSLLSSEALEDNLGVVVYPEVLDCFRVDWVTSGVAPSLHGSGILEGRESATAESLHDCEEIDEMEGEERKRGESV